MYEPSILNWILNLSIFLQAPLLSDIIRYYNDQGRRLLCIVVSEKKTL